jgi:hypothetical protein
MDTAEIVELAEEAEGGEERSRDEGAPALNVTISKLPRRGSS